MIKRASTAASSADRNGQEDTSDTRATPETVLKCWSSTCCQRSEWTRSFSDTSDTRADPETTTELPSTKLTLLIQYESCKKVRKVAFS